jgi:chromosome segregation ATPase
MLGWLKTLFCRKKSASELEKKELEDTIEFLKKEINYKNSIVLEKEKIISNLNLEAKKNDSIIQEDQENILRLEKEVKTLMNAVKEKDETLESKNAKLEFIANVINSLPKKNVSYEKYLKLLNEDYINFSNENDAFAAEAAAFLKLQSVSKQL